MRNKRVIHLAAAGAIAGTGMIGLSATSAFANSAAQHPPIEVVNPVITGPAPPFVSVGANCPSFLTTDTWAANFISGHAVSYGTSNKNGDWGGGNAEGTAILSTSDGTPQYEGHLHIWFGGGQNSLSGTNQTEQGFTVSYQGSGAAGSITINAHTHTTTNNSGRPTANVASGTVTCS